MHRVAMVRSFVTHEEVHLRGQYYVQAGRQLNVAFAREIPSIGSVVAYELESRRRASDTFPTYVSFNLETNQVGALSTGFLPPQYSVFDLNAAQALTGMTLDQKASELIEERWRVLQQLREINRGRMQGFGRSVEAFEDFSNTAKALLTDPRWPAAFKVSGRGPQALRQHRSRACLRARAQCFARGRRYALHPRLPARLGSSSLYLGPLQGRQSL